MNEQPEQQPQPTHPPVTELPAVPVVTEAPLEPQTPPVEPVQPQPTATELVATPEASLLVSEPMGRPVETQSGLEWRASEYIEHEKSVKWFIVLGVVTLALAAVALFVMKNYTFALLLVVMGIAIAVWAKRPAAELFYRLEATGVRINDKFFSMHDFRSFGLLQDGALYAVQLLPTKRFSPGVTVYFPHELGEQIVDTLGASLPMEDLQPDWIDKISRKLNF